ncbi:cation diffusion facilitator family transporter [Paenibacillus urinalis]|uniref:Cation diffusion facilitator family transporter n=1 Tax=Paenibacillus urinalis TaxID=521520 RepID=A0AAX3MZ05_9BACL|nr:MULTISPECIES: cation diffusion facilitator family transporter [Paenibacillus]WDH82039.1 cation diffusion facilitator family transporter [Paenibacillus urinalis]WDH98087.1 cation diffusion facilitator family transporter [Paenibacillus urinalis]WDI01770.1 cation diffusion facilitator family transporter [Paenibacillus urinalis]SDX66398.1 cation diffusion facilitator family transporter [Paenibacillus sp. PDC88]GAK42705.1 cation diffusion facilitator family transporter [Paenibacillus sp. TCA20]
MNAYDDIKKGERGAWISIAAYLVLSAFKLICGFAFNSSALKADGFNNLTDIVASIAVLIGLRISRKPPDSDHAYGHFRAETVAALVASFIMAMVGIQVLIDAGTSLFEGTKEIPDIWSALVAGVAAVVMIGVYLYNRKLARQIRSQALMAAAKDNLSDAFVSVGAAIGIIGAQFGLPWMDTVAAFIVGLLICKTAWDIFRESTHSLTDGFDEDQLHDLRTTVAKTPGVQGIKDVKARLYGSHVMVDVVVEVARDLSIVEGHHISDTIEENMRRHHNIMHVHVHVEPEETRI